MKALQYIYTSWKNGNSTDKGYMIYSRSLGISDKDCTAIKDAMQYMAPKKMNLTPTLQEIQQVFPYSFAYFSLPSGKKCIAESTYLGKDYSGRYGNYIIYALIVNPLDIPCRPFEFFGEKYIKTEMTTEELNASSPVPPLPELDIESYGTIINDERLNEFLFEREDEFAKLISFVLESSEKEIPVFLNDTRENLVLWVAATQRIFPHDIALKFSFNTYIGNHEFIFSKKAKESGLKFYLVGVRPDANYFDYANERYNNRCLVIDFVNGYATENISVSNYAKSMSTSMATDFEEIDLFGNFLNEIAFKDISKHLESAYDYYKLLKYGEFQYSDEKLKKILNFGEKYSSETFNSDIGSKLLSMVQENEWEISIDTFQSFWIFCCKYSEFMIYTLFELLQNLMYNSSLRSDNSQENLLKLTNSLKESTPKVYNNFLEYEQSPQEVNNLLLYMNGENNIDSNIFYIKWLLASYPFSNGLNNRQPLDKFLNTLLNNIAKLNNTESTLQILLSMSSNQNLFEDAIKILIKSEDMRLLESLCDTYYGSIENIDEKVQNQFINSLMKNSDTSRLAISILIRKIETSSKPEEKFWNVYSQYKHLIKNIDNTSIAPIISACLKKLKGESKEITVVRMLHEIDESFLFNPETIPILSTALENFSIKSLIIIKSDILEIFYKSYIKQKSVSLPKLASVVLGNYFLNLPSEQYSLVRLADILSKSQIYLSNFEKNDYKIYLEKYRDCYFSLINSEQDIENLFKFFYNKKFFDEFVKSYLKYVKNTKNSRSKDLNIWSIACILKNPSSDMMREMQPSFVRHLRGIEQPQLLELKNLLLKLNITQTDIDSFFENVTRKESIYEKLTSIFRR